VITRREWLRAAVVAGGAVLASSRAESQDVPTQLSDTSNLFAMDQGAARSVRLPPKPGVSPSMSADERDALEHRIRCQCGCTLDVFTCRTTDFSCQVSPAMHRDILALVQGGYTAQEILDGFVRVYGDRALMAPPKVGFNIVGYVLPGITIALGAVGLLVMMRRWKRPVAAGGAVVPPPRTTAFAPPAGASPDELARLEAAIRDDR
jgi:cytochrome c-type biogenesis protein CcmH